MPTPALYINEFSSGLYTQRSPLVTPTTSVGLSTMVRSDVLVDGSNVEMSNRSTIIRRYGFSKYCTTLMPDFPRNFHSFRNTSGAIKLLVDGPNEVDVFTTNTVILLFTKSGGAGTTRFQTVANDVFMCDGVDNKRYNGTALTAWGITAPATAPTISMGAGALTPLKGYRYCYTYRDDTAQHESTASPFSPNTFSQTGKNFTLQGAMSTDPRVSSIVIYRILDGGSVYYRLASVTNTGSGTWTYVDSSTDDALNNFITAPVNHANDPPPSGANNIIFHMGRLWLSVGNALYFAGGPDTIVGSGVETFPPANKFTVPSTITAMISVSSGLLVFTDTDCYIVRGNDAGSFYIQPWMMNFGVETQDCVASDGDLAFIYTSRRQLFSINTSLDEIGFAVGDLLLTGFDPTKTFLTLHRSGTDAALFVSNGVDSYFRYQINKDSWSPLARPVGGVGCLKSVQVAKADYRLLLGRASGANSYILNRNLATNADDGSTFTASATIGTLVVAPLGSTESIEAISVERMPTGSDATVSVLANEVSGTFTPVPNPENEPPLYPRGTSIVSKRHYLKAAQKPIPQKIRHLQVKIEFPSENQPNELIGFALIKP